MSDLPVPETLTSTATAKLVSQVASALNQSAKELGELVRMLPHGQATIRTILTWGEELGFWFRDAHSLAYNLGDTAEIALRSGAIPDILRAHPTELSELGHDHSKPDQASVKLRLLQLMDARLAQGRGGHG